MNNIFLIFALSTFFNKNVIYCMIIAIFNSGYLFVTRSKDPSKSFNFPQTQIGEILFYTRITWFPMYFAGNIFS